MNYILFIVVFAFIIELIKERKKIFTPKPEWQSILLILLLGISAYCIYSDNTETSNKIDGLKIDNKSLNGKVDSLKNSFDSGINATALNMAYRFGEGVRHGDTNTYKILSDALANKKELKHTVDSMQRKLDSINKSEDPFISCPVGIDPAVSHQSNDTFYFSFIIANTGKKGTSMTVQQWFMVSRNGIDYSFKKSPIPQDIPISGVSNFESASSSVAHFIFHTESDELFIIILGDYDTYKGQKQKINIVYSLGPRHKTWLLDTDIHGVENRLKYSVPFEKIHD